MKKLVLATRNAGKVKEMKKLLEGFDVLSLDDIGFEGDVDETGTTTGENAKLKAVAICDFCHSKNLDYGVIADDSGLFVNALGGAPGVHSARYAGNHDDAANRKKLLAELDEKLDRNAYFETTMCYADYSGIRLFVGRAFGKILTEERGDNGFGYDSLFYSDDLNKTFAEATTEEKSSVSHRGRALEKLKDWLKKTNVNYDRTLKFNN